MTPAPRKVFRQCILSFYVIIVQSLVIQPPANIYGIFLPVFAAI